MLTLLRKFIAFVFGIEALVLLPVLPIAVYAIVRRGYHNPRWNVTYFLLSAAALTVLGAGFAVASWTLKRSKASARWWGLGASVGNLLLSIPFLAYLPLRFGTLFWLIPISGIVGICILWGPSDSSVSQTASGKARPMPGDGTHALVNVLPWLVGTLGGLGGYIWCIQWCRENGVHMTRGLSRYAAIMIALLLVTLIHEAGHAFAAWSVQMKIRAFVVGPFQFRMHRGTWNFRFDLGQTFSANGATGAVHTNPYQPLWCDLFMIVAGPLANLGTGMIALCAVFLIEPSSSLQAHGMLFLFGIYSLLAFLTNLIPFRTGEQYSDGAKIYQLMNGGAFADLHGAMSLVSSTLVTSLRPRDYNVKLIERAAAGAAQGKLLMLLHLFRYQHFLDCGELPEAAQAMSDAEAVYLEIAAEVPAELHAGFVFGNAYVKRDAVAARQWWQRLEEKKPTKFDGDYWLAHCALHWIEGNLYIAKDSWHTGAAMVSQLPAAGAYDFDRSCFELLHEELNPTSCESLAPVSERVPFYIPEEASA
jgi:hypothetical protein